MDGLGSGARSEDLVVRGRRSDERGNMRRDAKMKGHWRGSVQS